MTFRRCGSSCGEVDTHGTRGTEAGSKPYIVPPSWAGAEPWEAGGFRRFRPFGAMAATKPRSNSAASSLMGSNSKRCLEFYSCAGLRHVQPASRQSSHQIPGTWAA